jgi:hypothetical protein
MSDPAAKISLRQASRRAMIGAVTLVITDDLRAELMDAAGQEVETAAVLFASLVTSADGGRRLLATGIRWCTPGSYAERHQDGLLITSDGYVPALAEAEAAGLIALWLHTHRVADIRMTSTVRLQHAA